MLEADAIVIATGARARALPFGRDLEGLFELRTLEDARRLRSALESTPRVVVVGAGFIGMEVAASCRQRGLEVSVVEPLEAPLIRGLGSVLGERVAARHRAEGVEFHLGVGVEGFEGEGRVSGVRLSDGRILPAEVVVVGVGAAPATEWLGGSGLEIDNGLLCDATGRTSRPGVWALGDCARWENPRYPERPRLEHWTSGGRTIGCRGALHRAWQGPTTLPRCPMSGRINSTSGSRSRGAPRGRRDARGPRFDR